MSATAIFSRSPCDRDKAVALLGRLPGADRRGTHRRSWDVGHCRLEFSDDAELFLAHINTDPAKGPRFCVLIMGYVAHRHEHRSGRELAERLLQEWRGEGARFLDGLEGSFSIFMHDMENDQSLIATDCIASRMLWHSEQDGIHVIGTDLTAVAHCRRGPLSIDHVFLWSFLMHARTVSTRTFFGEIRSIEPGLALTFQGGLLTRRDAYFSSLYKSDSRRSPTDLAAELVDALSVTMREICRDRTRPALFLSGGLDSRLLAGLCPEHVTAVTLCDRQNAEVTIAGKTAARTGLRHRIIHRTPDWYPSLIEEASERFSSMWAWTEAHFLPLKHPQNDFDFDAVMLGWGSDTYFKGFSLKWPRLWEGGRNVHTPPRATASAALDLVTQAPYANPRIQRIFETAFESKCRDEFREVARRDLERIIPYCENLPDLWELFWDRSIGGEPGALNLVSLRDFTSERNAFSTRRLRALSLQVPPHVRASGRVIRQALKLAGKGLVSLPDSSTMLPPLVPQGLHRTASKARARLSALRGRVLRARKSRDVATQSAWTRIDRLITVNDRVRSMLLDLIDDDAALPPHMLDKAKIRAMVKKHLDGEGDYSAQLALLMTFGLYHRKIMPLLR